MLSYVFQYKFSILLAIVIAMLSLLPSSSMPDSPLFSIPFLDKIVHFSMYASFGFVALLECRCKGQCIRFHLLLLMVIFIMSAIIEVLQATVVSTRAAEWFDLFANFTGLLAGYIAFRVIRSLRIFTSLRS